MCCGGSASPTRLIRTFEEQYKWQERPLACVVLKEGMVASEEELLAFLESQFAPDDVVFLDEIPKTSVGKFLKAKLRDNVAEIYPKLASFV